VASPRSAGAVVFRRTPKGVQLLILRAYNLWDFPKGLVEEDEKEFDASRREVWEETGLSDIDYPFGEEFKETLPYSGGKVARYYLAETETEKIVLPVSPELGKPEHDAWRWVSFEEAEDYLAPRLAGVLEWAKGMLSR
jgi:8-oxo-dGTP pyrophosphatase MutT (NUDIX family)